jgi:hypothetical protein
LSTPFSGSTDRSFAGFLFLRGMASAPWELPEKNNSKPENVQHQTEACK